MAGGNRKQHTPKICMFIVPGGDTEYVVISDTAPMMMMFLYNDDDDNDDECGTVEVSPYFRSLRATTICINIFLQVSSHNCIFSLP